MHNQPAPPPIGSDVSRQHGNVGPQPLWIGDTATAEFETLREWFSKRGATFAVDVNTAIDQIRNGLAPAVIVVVERWPGEIKAWQIDLLRRNAPLARIVRLLGSWLEGELRTGKPPAGTLRAYWHQAMPRLQTAVEKLIRGESKWLTAPVTSDDAERLWRRDSIHRRPDVSALKVAVIAPNRQRAEAIVDDCRVHGWAAKWIQFDSLAAAAETNLTIYDSLRLSESDFDALAKLRAMLNENPIVVLAGFPRIEDVERLRAFSPCTVISKPYSIDQLDQLVSRCEMAHSANSSISTRTISRFQVGS